MKKILIFYAFLAGLHLIKADYVCFLMMNTEIKNTMEENERQKTMQKEQLQNLGIEEVNKTQWTEFKTTYTKIRNRLNTVSLAIQAIPLANNIVHDMEMIYQNQRRIYEELANAPMFIVVALPAEFQFVENLEMNLRLMAGIILSYGAINQMEKKERKILLDYVEQEIGNLRDESSNILSLIIHAKWALQWKKHLLSGWISQDKEIFTDILKNAKNL